MEKVKFVDPDTGESLAFFVVEETKVGGTHYLLATEEEDGDCDAYIKRGGNERRGICLRACGRRHGAFCHRKSVCRAARRRGHCILRDK